MLFRITCGLLLIMQTGARLWMTRNKRASSGSRFYHKTRETIFIRLAGAGVALAYLYVFLPETSFLDFPMPAILRWIGFALMLAGNLLFIFAHRSLGKQWSAELEIQPQHALITSGVYKYVRHPMYTAFLAFGLGLILLTANLLGCAYLPVVSVMIAIRLPAEEAMLKEEFGDAYQAYKAKSSALIPGIL